MLRVTRALKLNRNSICKAPVRVSKLSLSASLNPSLSANGSPAVTEAAGAPVLKVTPAPEAIPALLAPAANYDNIVMMGTKKANTHAGKTFILGIMAGWYIGIASFIFLYIGGGMPGLLASNPALFKLTYAFIFPVGLLMVILSGADLFTGNTAVVTSALLEKKISFGQLGKNFFFSYTGNFVGSLMIVAAVLAAGSLTGNSMATNAAVAKTSLPWGTALIRGILANWLVCIAVFHASAASTLPGKMLGLWFPIAAFVTVGLEHSVANMFIIPMGMVLGAKVSISDFIINNLIPVTIGNTIAGTVFMALTYSMCFGSLGKSMFQTTGK
jgi:formate/nitrite transporter